MHNLILFASGNGSNVKAILDYFRDHPQVDCPLILSNRPHARVLDIAREEKIPFQVIGKSQLESKAFQDEIRTLNPSLLVLAGFLWRIPASLIESFPNQWINIHPALLPLYGGPGMYGRHVHEAVLANGDTRSGITIHYVDSEYDSGPSLVQAYCPVLPGDDPDLLARRIHQLEHYYYPRTLEFLLLQSPLKTSQSGNQTAD